MTSAMSRWIHFRVIISLFICFALVGEFGLVLSQTCTDDQVTIKNSSTPCEGDINTYIRCKTAMGLPLMLFKDDEVIYNGSSLAADLQSRASISTHSSISNNCHSVFIRFLQTNVTDTGNYTCQTNTSQSEVLRFVVEPKILEHECLIDSLHGPIVQDGKNVTCRSRTGHPSWIGLEMMPSASEVDTGSISDVGLVFNSSSSSLSTTLRCQVTSFLTSVCPPVTSTCSERLLVVPNATENYLSLFPSVNTIILHEVAMFSCITSLIGTTVVWTPLAAIAPELYSTHKTSDTIISITFRNITTNYTEPVVQCSLQYNNELATSMSGSVVVLPSDEVEGGVTTAQPTTPSSITGGSDVPSSVASVSGEETLSTTDINTVTRVKNTNATTEPVATTGGLFVGGGGFDVDIRILISGLVVGLLIFIAVVVLVALLLKRKAKKKGDWTVDTISSRRGRAEVAASDGIAGRLEWETDTNPLVVYETTIMSFGSSDENDDNGSITSDDVKNTTATMRNGYAMHTDEAPVLGVAAVIEPHDEYQDSSVSSKADKDPPLRGSDGLGNKGYDQDESPIVVHHYDEVAPKEVSDREAKIQEAEIDRTHVTNKSASLSNGHVINKESDGAKSDTLDSGVPQEEIHLDVLNFIDATRLEGDESDLDGESSVLSLGRESVLSEIDDSVINIVAV